MYICILGTSDIVHHHLKCAIKLKIKIFCISSTNKKSKSINSFYSKYHIEKRFNTWREAVRESAKIKNCHFLIATRIQDNIKVLNECLKYNRKIFIEKPLSLKSSCFYPFLEKDNIFIGYNRIFYKNVEYVKKLIDPKDKYIINVKCPETNKRDIIANSCHIFSILISLFGNLNIKRVTRENKFIHTILENRAGSIFNFSFVFDCPDNFLIEILDKKQKILLSPIESLKIYNRIEITKKDGNRIFKTKENFTYDEYTKNNFKPGFYKQMSLFKSLNNNSKYFFSIRSAQEIIKICENIVNVKKIYK